jgi:hypothetical protein
MTEESVSNGEAGPRRHRHGLVRFGCGLFSALRGLVYLCGLAWATGAIYFDGPVRHDNGNAVLAASYLILALLFLAGLTRPLRRFTGWILAMAVVVVPWSTIRPTDEGDWPPQWRRTGWAKIDGDHITFKNLRNFDYALDGTVTERWEDRTVRLSRLRGLDLFHHAFEGDLLAHPVLSFDFAEDGHVAFSVESRRRKGERFVPLAGLYKRYGLICLAGDERDFIRERATFRDEPVRLYRSTFDQAKVLTMFLNTIAALNELHKAPRFYNTITANCTTSYRAQAAVADRSWFDYRLLLNGRIESLFYERGALVTDGLPLDQLVERASINEAAMAAHDDPEFSARIREGRPGF